MTAIDKYFPDLTDRQHQQMAALGALYADWNAKINVVSRKDIDQIYEHHILHSLAIARFVRTRLEGGWPSATRIVDVGTGGGLPGIPLAIVCPDCHFLLVDRIGKKVRVAQEIATAIGLDNVETLQAGIEEVSQTFDYAVSRAVMPLPDLVKAARRTYTRGLICLKGGDLTDELRTVQGVRRYDIAEWFDEEFFATKQVVYVPRPAAPRPTRKR